MAEGELISEESLAEMTDWVDDDDGGLYGLGLVNYTEEGIEAYGHSGASSGFQSDMAFLPQYNVTVIVLTNNYMSEAIGDIFTDVSYAIVQEVEE